MLFNPSWDTKSLTLSDFREFCESMPPRRRYVYADRFTCACGRWLKARGLTQQFETYGTWLEHDVVREADRKALIYPHTFGALAKRLRAAESMLSLIGL